MARLYGVSKVRTTPEEWARNVFALGMSDPAAARRLRARGNKAQRDAYDRLLAADLARAEAEARRAQSGDEPDEESEQHYRDRQFFSGHR